MIRIDEVIQGCLFLEKIIYSDEIGGQVAFVNSIQKFPFLYS